MAAQAAPLAQQPALVPARQAGSRGRSSTSGSTRSSTSSSASDSSQSRAAGRNAASERSRLRPCPSLMHAPDQHRHRSSKRPPSRPGHSRENGLSRCDACCASLLCVYVQRTAQHHRPAVCCTCCVTLGSASPSDVVGQLGCYHHGQQQCVRQQAALRPALRLVYLPAAAAQPATATGCHPAACSARPVKCFGTTHQSQQPSLVQAQQGSLKQLKVTAWLLHAGDTVVLYLQLQPLVQAPVK